VMSGSTSGIAVGSSSPQIIRHVRHPDSRVVSRPRELWQCTPARHDCRRCLQMRTSTAGGVGNNTRVCWSPRLGELQDRRSIAACLVVFSDRHSFHQSPELLHAAHLPNQAKQLVHTIEAANGFHDLCHRLHLLKADRFAVLRWLLLGDRRRFGRGRCILFAED